MHLGHRHLLGSLLSQAADTALEPIAVTFDRHPLSTVNPDLAPPLLMPHHERIEALRRHIPQVAVVPFTPEISRLSAADFMQWLHHNYHVAALHLGFNHRFGSDRLQSLSQYARAAAPLGISVSAASEFTLPDGSPVNSSLIRRCLADFSTVSHALTALGHPYALTGQVVHGRHIGTELGFPTANILPLCDRQIIPPSGVYAATAILPDHTEHPTMVNIGRRPTFHLPDAPPAVEAHILGLKADLYGQTITLRFIAPLRHERRFPSVDALKDQLAADALAVKNIL